MRGPVSVRPLFPQQAADSELREFGLKGPGRAVGGARAPRAFAAPWADESSAAAPSSTNTTECSRLYAAKKNESHGGLGEGLNPDQSAQVCAAREMGLPRRRPSQARSSGTTPFGTETDVPPRGHVDIVNPPDSPIHTSRAMAESLSRLEPDQKTREELHRVTLGFRRRSAQSSSPRQSIPYAWAETPSESRQKPKTKAKATATTTKPSSTSASPSFSSYQLEQLAQQKHLEELAAGVRGDGSSNKGTSSLDTKDDSAVQVMIQTVLSSTPSRVTPIMRSFEAPRCKAATSSRSSTPRNAPVNGVRRSSSAGTDRDRRFGLGFGSSSPRDIQAAVPASQMLRSSVGTATSAAAAAAAAPRSARPSVATPRSVSASRRSIPPGTTLGEKASLYTSTASRPQVKTARPTLSAASIPSSKSASATGPAGSSTSANAAKTSAPAIERSSAPRAVATPQRQKLREERVLEATARPEPRRSLGAISSNLPSRNGTSCRVVQHTQPWDSSQGCNPRSSTGAEVEPTVSTRQWSKREQVQCSERISQIRSELQLLSAKQDRNHQEMRAEIMQTASLKDH